MNFIVVKVFSDYDYTEYVDYIGKFSTEEEANYFIQSKKDEQNSDWKIRRDYIDKWVDTLELPETDYNGWKEYLTQYYPFGARYVMPKDFKKELKYYLNTNHPANFKNYNPPPADLRWSNLFVVEIK